jgi:hypothetical protein
MMVGSLAGKRFPIGAEIEVESASLAIVSGIEIPQRTTLRLIGRVPCAEGRTGARCVEVAMHTVHDTTVLSNLVRAAGAREFEMYQDLVLITEPGTLLPHRSQLREVRRYVARIENAEVPVEEVVVTTWAFAYGRT